MAKKKISKKRTAGKKMAKKKEKTTGRKAKGKEKETMRQSAAKLRKDLEEFLDILEAKGTRLPPEELQGFEERQFDHITSKIADAIIARIGEKKFRQISERLKSGKLSLTEAASKLGIKMGDLVLILEARKVFTEAELKKRLETNRKP